MTLTDLWREQPSGFIRDNGNEQQSPLAVGASFTGQWRKVGDHAGFVVLYATNVAPATLEIQWSRDGVNQASGPFASSALRVGVLSGFNIAFSVQNIAVEPWYRLHVVNGATAQLVVYCYAGVLGVPWTGTFSGVTDPIAAMSVALLTRSVLIGDLGGGNYGAVQIAADRSLTATVNNMIPTVETGLAKDANLTALLAHLTDGTQRANMLRPSQLAGRTHIDRSVSGIATTTTIYTVTAGKTFWLTDLVYSFVAVQANATLSITDGATVKAPLVGGSANSVLAGSVNFNEPVPFTTSVLVTKGLLGVLASVTVSGYEE